MNESATTGVDPCLVMPVRVGCVCACFTCLPDSLPTFMQSSRYSAGSKKAKPRRAMHTHTRSRGTMAAAEPGGTLTLFPYAKHPFEEQAPAGFVHPV